MSAFSMKAACVLALVGALALLSPAVQARQLKQDNSAITDADVLNFALNLEVSGTLVHLPVSPVLYESYA